MREDIKIVFMGTPDFAACSLKEIIENKFNVVGCFTNQDKPSGRGMKLKFSEVKEYALSQNIPVYQPQKIRNNPEVMEILKELNPDLIVVVAYGKILPKELLEFPRLGCVNVHGSLLPKYRGAAPMQWSIIKGEKMTGITTMFMDEGVDTGDMLLREEVEISEDDNFETLHDKMKVVGAKLLVKTLDKVIDGSIVRIEQPVGGNYAPMINKEMTKIDFNKSACEIYNFVRGLSPFPSTYVETKENVKYKIYKVKVVEQKDKYIIGLDSNKCSNGEVVVVSKDRMYIKCGDGYISICEIQPQNSKKMDIVAFLQGNKVELGTIFM
jgi:methionyl-tRNA formyltransferase